MRIGLDDTGRGEPVVLLHSSCSSRRQWRRLVAELAGRYRTLALDLHGYGETSWPADPETFGIDDEVALVEHVLDRVAGPAHLVGHSYGGVVALATALRHPQRVRSLALHEPVVFQLALAGPLAAVGAEITRMVELLAERVEAGAPAAAAEHFIDYWRGAGTWAALPEKGRQAAARVIPKLPVELRAMLRSPYTLRDYGTIRSPVCLMAGTVGRAAARRVAELLATVLPDGSLQLVVAGHMAGHMAPVTHRSSSTRASRRTWPRTRSPRRDGAARRRGSSLRARGPTAAASDRGAHGTR